MAIFSYTQNGILFNKLDNSPKPIKKVPGKIFNSNNDYEYAADGIEMSIDAVTIDWNGAEVAGQTLNTTGEVLSMLGYAYTAIGESKDITLKIGNTEKTFNVNETSNVEWTLKEIGAAAESHTHTGEYAPNVHTHTNYQEKLISGDNIKTINGNSILGSGNITISAGSSVDLSNYYTKVETETYFISPDEMSYYVSHEMSYYVLQQGYITSIPKATASMYGTIKIGFTSSGHDYAVKNDTKGNAYVNVPWTDTKYDTQINSINNTLTSINTTIEALAARITALEQNNTPVNIPVKSITIEPSSYTFYGSEVEKVFTANVLPSNATNKSIKWSFVDNNSYVQKVSETNNTITIKSIWTFNNDDEITPDFNLKATALDGSNVYGTSKLNVKNIAPAPTTTPTVPVNQTYVNSIKINSNDSNYPEEIHLYGSTSYKLTYTITPQNADDKRVEFSFENGIPNSNTWALLDASTGVLTTRGVSDSLIVKATAKDQGRVSDTIRINIHYGELKSFDITATTTELPAAGGSAYFYITNEVSTKFASQDKTNYEWSLEKVTIEGGISTYGINEPADTPSAPGTSNYPTTEPGSSDAPNLPTEPYLSNTTGNDTTVVFPANTSTSPIAYRITAIGDGKTDCSREIIITIDAAEQVNIPVKSITIEPSSYSFYGSGVEKTFAANVLPSNATDKSIKWSFVDNNSYVQKVSETNNTITIKSIWTFNNDYEVTPDFNLKATALDGSNVYGTSTLNVKNIAPAPTSTPTVPVNQTYYWYAGQTQPTSLTTNPTPSTTYTNNNWFELGTTLPTVINQRVTGGTSGQVWYAAVPTDAGLVPGADGVEDSSMTKIKTITVNGVKYDVWDALGVTQTRFTVQFYKK